MIELLVAVGLFGGMVWMIAHAIFLLMHSDADGESSYRACDTVARFVEENYGSRFVHDASLPEQCLRRL